MKLSYHLEYDKKLVRTDADSHSERHPAQKKDRGSYVQLDLTSGKSGALGGYFWGKWGGRKAVMKNGNLIGSQAPEKSVRSDS